MKTTITRDTETSFLKVITNPAGAEFSRKLEKGSPEYANACHDFHMAGVEIATGNSISE